MSLEPLDFPAILMHIRAATGLQEITLGEDGCCELSIDDSFTVSLGYNEKTRQLVLFSTVGALADDSPAVWRMLLQANLFWRETDGATLSLDSRAANVVLARQERIYRETADTLPALLEQFINLTDVWIRKLKDPPAAEPGSSDTITMLKV